ncbi:NifU N-terminal domain-containing protein [Halolactibacillus sp. JCM 19043]|uniref:NifU N-terminal domain-containing protein n=1 Tax=Halolactibacillus sp. JCM 19043 TaxID=1460638 RepID=UPI001E29466A|nr:NifU N-terminal domain-containing protein [Halolactibacillus sp. JCM 19043]
MLNDLLTLDGVNHVFGYQTFITIIKEPNVHWDQLIPSVTAVMTAFGLAGEETD